MLLRAFCETSNGLQMFYFINMLVKILCYVVPAILILMLTIDVFKNIMSGDEGYIKKNMKVFIKRIIFSALIFFIPMIVNIAFGLLGSMNVSAAKCYNNANLSTIQSLKEKETKNYETKKEKERKAKEEQIEEDRAKQKEYYDSLGVSNTAEAITKIAFETAWPIDTSKNITVKKPTSIFKSYFEKVYPEHNKWGKCARDGKSCDVYVGTVIRATGYDTELPRGGAEQLPHYTKSSKWKEISGSSKTISEDKLQSGDVIFYSYSGGAHTFIYIVKDGVSYRAEASYCGHSAGHFGRLSKYNGLRKNLKKLYVFRATA